MELHWGFRDKICTHNKLTCGPVRYCGATRLFPRLRPIHACTQQMGVYEYIANNICRFLNLLKKYLQKYTYLRRKNISFKFAHQIIVNLKASYLGFLAFCYLLIPARIPHITLLYLYIISRKV